MLRASPEMRAGHRSVDTLVSSLPSVLNDKMPIVYTTKTVGGSEVMRFDVA